MREPNRAITTDGLTPKQELFAQEVAKGSTLSDAYRASYNADTMAVNTIHNAASDLAKQPRIQARVQQLLKEQERLMLRDSIAIRRHVFSGLMRESEVSELSSPMSRLKALELLGKIDIVSMFKERSEATIVDERKPEDLQAELRDRLKALMGKPN